MLLALLLSCTTDVSIMKRQDPLADTSLVMSDTGMSIEPSDERSGITGSTRPGLGLQGRPGQGSGVTGSTRPGVWDCRVDPARGLGLWGRPCQGSGITGSTLPGVWDYRVDPARGLGLQGRPC